MAKAVPIDGAGTRRRRANSAEARELLTRSLESSVTTHPLHCSTVFSSLQ